MNSKPKGRRLRIDRNAESAVPGEAAFIARPSGTPVYHGFPILSDVSVEGFTFGMISDFEAEPMECGDAFIVAPDNTRCGVVWEVTEAGYFEQTIPAEDVRWGVWAVAFPFPMTSRDNVRRNLEFILPRLKEQWLLWCEQQRPDRGT